LSTAQAGSNRNQGGTDYAEKYWFMGKNVQSIRRFSYHFSRFCGAEDQLGLPRNYTARLGCNGLVLALLTHWHKDLQEVSVALHSHPAFATEGGM
jgi:hypothetical protein